jgi:hypothetical protein
MALALVVEGGCIGRDGRQGRQGGQGGLDWGVCSAWMAILLDRVLICRN